MDAMRSGWSRADHGKVLKGRNVISKKSRRIEMLRDPDGSLDLSGMRRERIVHSRIRKRNLNAYNGSDLKSCGRKTFCEQRNHKYRSDIREGERQKRELRIQSSLQLCH
jgi:hypothetical protein